jgi:hypothetical protein
MHTNTIVETLQLHLYLNYETNEDVIVAVVLENYYWLTVYLWF